MDPHILIYSGNYKIAAIRSLRRHVKITLREAKNCITHTGGFILTNDTSFNVIQDYLDANVIIDIFHVPGWSVEIFSDQIAVDLRHRETATKEIT